MADINISLPPIVSTTVGALGGGTNEIATIMKRMTEIQKKIQELVHSLGTPEQKKEQMKALQAEWQVLTERLAQLQEEQNKKSSKNSGEGSVVTSALATPATAKSPLKLTITSDKTSASDQQASSADKLAPAGEAGSVVNTYA